MRKDILLIAIGLIFGLMATVFNHHIQEWLKKEPELIYLSYSENLSVNADDMNQERNVIIVGNISNHTAKDIAIHIGYLSTVPEDSLEILARVDWKTTSRQISKIQKSITSVWIKELKPEQVAVLKYDELYSSVSLAAYNQFPEWQVLYREGYAKNIHNNEKLIKKIFELGSNQFPLLVSEPSGIFNQDLARKPYRVNSLRE